MRCVARVSLVLLVLSTMIASNRPAIAADADRTAPIVIGHRGASGYRPEHTLAAYTLAIEQGVDFIEMDVVATKDGVLIVRHEPVLGEVDDGGKVVAGNSTTDIAARAEFAGRKTTRTIDGVAYTGWFAQDFTLAEIKALRAVQRLSFRDQSFNGQFAIPTLQEVVDLAKAKSKETGRTVGLYIETKHPTYHDAIGLSLDEPLVALLKQNDLARADSPVFIQSFEVTNLKKLNGIIDVRLVQLTSDEAERPGDVAPDGTTYGQMLSPAGLRAIATYADGIGPYKRSIVPVDEQGRLKPPTSLVRDAHTVGLLVHPYTFRDEADHFLAGEYNGDAVAEYRQFFQLGVDGVFSDNPDTAVRARAVTREASR